MTVLGKGFQFMFRLLVCHDLFFQENFQNYPNFSKNLVKSFTKCVFFVKLKASFSERLVILS